MKQTAVYVVSIWKRMWKTPGYLVIFFLTPFSLIFLSVITEREDERVRVAVYMNVSEEKSETEAGMADQETEFLHEIEESLLEREGIIVFEICDSEEQVKRQVAAKRVQCGYVFPTDLFERLCKGHYTRSIKSYGSPQNSMQTICDEVLFAEIFAVYEEMTFGEQISSYFLSEGEGNQFSEEGGEQLAGRAEEFMEKYLHNGSTFQFTYEDYQTESAEGSREAVQTLKANAGTGDLIPVRGIMALMIYLCALCGTLDALEDETAGRVQRLHKKWMFQILTISVPAFVMGVVALFAFVITGNFRGIGKEVGRMVFYQVILIVYCFVLKRIWKKEEQLSGAIPVLVLSAAVACPVFLDLSVFLPVLKVLEKLYPLAYYLRV